MLFDLSTMGLYWVGGLTDMRYLFPGLPYFNGSNLIVVTIMKN